MGRSGKRPLIIRFFVSPEEKKRMEAGAAAEQRSLSDFLRLAAEERAARVAQRMTEIF